MSTAAVVAPTSEPPEAHGDASTASRALNETLEDISESLRQISRPWSNPQAQGGMFRAMLENRVVRETEHFASLLDERVTDVVQGYKKLHELTATGPELVRKAAVSVVEGLGGQFERSEHKTITEIARAYDATYEELREVQQKRIAMSRVIQMPVSLYHLPARLNSGPVPQASAGPARRARMGLASTKATVNKAAERATAPTEPTVPLAPIATDQPLPIPRYPTSFVGPTPPTAPPSFWPAGAAVHAPSVETKRMGSATALQQQQQIKFKQGYGLPPEVQAALLLMPKPESHLYKAAPNVSFTRLRPKGQDTSFSSSRGRIPRAAPSPRRIRLEDLAHIERLERVMDALRERLADLEIQGGSSAAAVAALQALMKELAEKYKDLEGGLAAVSRRMDDIPLMAPSVAAPKPPQPAPLRVSTPAPREPVAPEPSSTPQPAMYRVLPVRTKTTKEVVRHETPIQIVDIVLGANVARLEVGGWAHAGAKDEKASSEEVEDGALGAPVVLRGEGRVLEDELGDLMWNADVKQQWRGWPQDVPHEEPQQQAKPAAPQMTVDEVVERILKALGTPPEVVTVDDKPSPAPAIVSAPVEDEDARRVREGREMAEEERRTRMADEAARERQRLREREHEEREARLAALRALSEARERAVEDAEAERRRAADREADQRAQAQLLRSLVEDLLKRVTAVESRPVVQETAPQPPPPPPPAPAVEPPQLVTRGIQVSQPVVLPPPPPRPPSPPPTPSQPYAPTPPRIPHVDRLPAVWLETLSDESSLSSSSVSASIPSPPQRRQHLSPPSLSPSGSEGQIFLDAEADDVSQGQLVRKYRLARYRATKVAVAQAVKEVEAVTRRTLRPGQGEEKHDMEEDGEQAVVAGPGDDDALRVGIDHVRVFERAHTGFDVSDTEEEQGTDADESRDETDHARQARRTAEHIGLFTGPPGVGQGMRLLQWRKRSET